MKYTLLLIILLTSGICSYGQTYEKKKDSTDYARHPDNFRVDSIEGFLNDSTAVNLTEYWKQIEATRLRKLLGDVPELPPVDYSKVEIIQVGTNNVGAKIKLTVVCDGYRDKTLAISSTANFFNTFLNTAPMSKYKSNYNCYAVWTASPNNGAKHPNTAPDCIYANPLVPVSDSVNLFNSTFDYGGTHRLLYSSDYTNINNLFNYAGAQRGLKFVNVGTAYYGGGGGSFAFFAGQNASAYQIAIHEYGHTFGLLADEYVSGSYGERPNMTKETTLATIKWASMIPANQLLPTPSNTNCGTVGLYLLGQSNGVNWYIPSCWCMMKNLGSPFCDVCSKVIEDSIKAKIGTVP
ncbi:MAG: M64 family metallopeptidase, partial [Pseudomonadota bacterium]